MDDGTLFDELTHRGSAADAPRKPIRTYTEGKYVIKVYQTLYDSSINSKYTVMPKNESKGYSRD